MAWVTPKTNWVNGDYFNLDPDYERIKGNCEHLRQLIEEIYNADPTSTVLETVSVDGYPTAAFFNKISTSIDGMMRYYTLKGGQSTRRYQNNGVAWNAQELNAIENNQLLLYNALTGQKSCLRRLQYTLGGVKLGS